MAKVEIEIDDDVLEAIERQGYRITKLSKPIDGEMYLSSKNIVGSWLCTETNFVWPIVKPIHDDSIPFPDWMQKKWQWVAINENGVVSAFTAEPKCYETMQKWDDGRQLLFLTIDGFDTSWVPSMPNGDWTKAKWRRRNA